MFLDHSEHGLEYRREDFNFGRRLLHQRQQPDIERVGDLYFRLASDNLIDQLLGIRPFPFEGGELRGREAFQPRYFTEQPFAEHLICSQAPAWSPRWQSAGTMSR